MIKKNVYKILRWGTKIKSTRLKLLGIWLLHCSHKRYIGIFFDPILACNLRCKMCYFSDPEKRKTYRGSFTQEEIIRIAESLFHRALKLQIGCGAEPTLYKELDEIIALGKRYGIPYISLTTNGNLLTKETLEKAIRAGLDELTLSVHGLTRETYEFMMTNGKFELFLRLLADIEEMKKRYPHFKLRINYTINPDNMDELKYLWTVIKEMDILQLRPIQKIGDSVYQNFNREYLYTHYDDIINPIKQECQRRNITYLIPEKENLGTLEEDKNDDRIEQATYCYVSPRGCWKDDFDFRKDTFESYARRTHLGRHLLTGLLHKATKKKVDTTRKMNYNIN